MISSNLPDSDDIQCQVLLLGITRYETTPAPSQSNVHERLRAQSTKSSVCDNGRIGCVNDNKSINSLVVVYQSNERLHKSGCFPLELHKINKAFRSTETTPHQRQLTGSTQLNRLQSTPNSKIFYRWLHLKQKNTLTKPSTEHIASTGQQPLPQSRRSPSRKSLANLDSIKKQSKSTASRKPTHFSSCLPYCASSVRHGSIASSSLASNQLYCNESQTVRGLDEPQHMQQQSQRRQTDNCLFYCTVNKTCAYNRNRSNQNTVNDINSTNNCNLLINSNKMDRSVDSIGSCSLDVDAESTDFSGILPKISNFQKKQQTNETEIYFRINGRKKKKIIKMSRH